MQGANNSAEIENVTTTHDEPYKTDLFEVYIKNPTTKKVSRYALSLKTAFDQVKCDQLISVNRIMHIHSMLEQNNASIRRLRAPDLNEQANW